MSRNGINSAGITTNGRIMSWSSRSRMWQWVHVAPAKDAEANDDVDDLVRIHADGVLQAELVLVEPV
jgi:hypothetical protein